jgi:hypothetical protein
VFSGTSTNIPIPIPSATPLGPGSCTMPRTGGGVMYTWWMFEGAVAFLEACLCAVLCVAYCVSGECLRPSVAPRELRSRFTRSLVLLEVTLPM